MAHGPRSCHRRPGRSGQRSSHRGGDQKKAAAWTVHFWGNIHWDDQLVSTIWMGFTHFFEPIWTNVSGGWNVLEPIWLYGATIQSAIGFRWIKKPQTNKDGDFPGAKRFRTCREKWKVGLLNNTYLKGVKAYKVSTLIFGDFEQISSDFNIPNQSQRDRMGKALRDKQRAIVFFCHHWLKSLQTSLMQGGLNLLRLKLEWNDMNVSAANIFFIAFASTLLTSWKPTSKKGCSPNYNWWTPLTPWFTFATCGWPHSIFPYLPPIFPTFALQ